MNFQCTIKHTISMQVSISDRLPRVEVERMVNNYNLIYGLGFSPEQVTEAVGKSLIVERHEEEQKDVVSIDSLLSQLMTATG